MIRLTFVRTSSEVCLCKNPRANHYGYIYERGDGTAHYPQRYVKGERRRAEGRSAR